MNGGSLRICLHLALFSQRNLKTANVLRRKSSVQTGLYLSLAVSQGNRLDSAGVLCV